MGNIQEIFATDIKIAIPDPVYPVYVDTNVMAGRTGAHNQGRYNGIVYLLVGPVGLVDREQIRMSHLHKFIFRHLAPSHSRLMTQRTSFSTTIFD